MHNSDAILDFKLQTIVMSLQRALDMIRSVFNERIERGTAWNTSSLSHNSQSSKGL